MSTSNTGLGRGLGSLIPNMRSVSQTKPTGEHLSNSTFEENYTDKNILIERIIPNPLQPRKNFDQKNLDELTESIKQHGVLSPIIVSACGDNSYELIAGERRWRAAKAAGLKKIPAVIRDFAEQEKMEVAIIENIQRKNLDPVEEAVSFKHLLEEFDLTHDAVAKRLGKSRSHITNILRILSLPSEVQTALQAGKISLGHAKIILTQDDEQSQLNLYRKVLVNNLSVRESEKLVSSRKPRIKTSKPSDPMLENMEKMLRDNLDTKVSIVKKGRQGKLMIEFYSDEDLDMLIQKICE